MEILNTPALVEALAAELGSLGALMATAESCTGGMVAAACTDLAGSSAWLDRGLVCYSNEAKHQLLGVPWPLLEQHGAVSEPVARAMAAGALSQGAARYSVAVTGIAGPGGAVPGKPVGTVWLAWGWRAAGGEAVVLEAERQQFAGDRAAVRQATVQHALSGLLRRLKAWR